MLRLETPIPLTATPSSVAETIAFYLRLHDAHGGDAEARRRNYAAMTQAYYDLVTDLYELAWGRSFHFAPRHRDESFPESLVRHEIWLAHRLGLTPGMDVVDIGAGVGGPMRTIARFSGANVVGVNNSAYQVARGKRYNAQAGLQDQCSFLLCDFMRIQAPDERFDAAYAVEATVHAPDKARCFAEVRRVLRPGAPFGGYEWCLTDRYDPEDPNHRRLKRVIEEGDSLHDLATMPEVVRALETAGFDVLEAKDLAPSSDAETPWWLPLRGEGLRAFACSRTGRWLTHWALRALERGRLVPSGVSRVQWMLNETAEALIEAGELGIFTPAFFFLAKRR